MLPQTATFSVSTFHLTEELYAELAAERVLSLDSTPTRDADDAEITLPLPPSPSFSDSFLGDCSAGSSIEALTILEDFESSKRAYTSSMHDVAIPPMPYAGVKRARTSKAPSEPRNDIWNYNNPLTRLIAHALGDRLIGGQPKIEGFVPLDFLKVFIPIIRSLPEKEGFDKDGFLFCLTSLDYQLKTVHGKNWGADNCFIKAIKSKN